MGYKVSIIVPIYNVEAYLRQCVDSLLEQDCNNLEIILVDDGSVDLSGAICDEYAKDYSYVRVFHKKNGGLGSARNYGLRYATGKYILFIDSDDYLKKNSLGSVIQKADAFDLDLVMFGCIPFTDDGHPQNNMYPRSKLDYQNVMSGEEGLRQALSVGQYVTSVCMRLMKTDYIRKSGMSFNEKIIHEDEDFAFITYIQAKRVLNIPDEIYMRRYRQGSILTTRSFDKVYEGYQYAINSINNYLIGNANSSSAEEMSRIYQNNLIKAIINIWTELPKYDRKKKKNAVDTLINLNKDNDRFLSPGYAFLYKHIDMYRVARIINTSIRKRKDRIRIILRFLKHEPEVFIKVLSFLSRKKKIILLGTPHHGNVGDHLIAEAEKEFVKHCLSDKKLIDCSMMFSKEKLGWIKKVISKDDIIAISGGGWLGTEWRHNEEFVRNVIYQFPNNKIVIFPQTAYYKDDEGYILTGATIYSNHCNLYFACRDQSTYDFIKEKGFVTEKSRIMLMPDMALLSSMWRKAFPKKHRKHLGLCLRDDCEACLSAEVRKRIVDIIFAHDKEYVNYNTNENKSISSFSREKYILRKMNELTDISLLVTDRLHAMVLAALTGTPCIALDNSTHKVTGVYKWISDLNYIRLASNTAEIEDFIKEYSFDNTEWCYSDRNREYFFSQLTKWFI